MPTTVTLNLAGYLKSTLEPALAARMDATGAAMLAVAQSVAPVDTGALKASLGYRYDPAARQLDLFAATPYAVPVEVGYRRQTKRGFRFVPPQPYLRPAFRAVGPAWE